ncbi:3-oxoacyl-[acyl-carrier-protein] reductase [Gammaproteobacteria bacterium]|jgi:3-oxoacyl-[acyl-carrier protein] reductase|nr:3-oxoacyl-[acyl-carrier-protein] reductase [Gammaproteobacteria bacterium]
MDKKVVLISGASRGIGAAIAMHLASLGYKVIGTARSEFKFDKPSDNLIPLKLDITCRESIKNCAAKLKEQNLLPDILINNAGITSDQLFLRMKDDEWDNVLATNLTGTFNLTKAFIKNMIKNRYGRIINISSISGLMGNPGQVNYSSAKAGLSGFTKSLAKEVGSRNITVNSVAPGFIETDMTSFLDEDSKNTIIKDIPLNRLGSPEDVSELVAFLAGDESQYITGQTISIDGGLFMH